MEADDSPAPEPTPPPAGGSGAERPQIRRLVITKMELENFKSYAGVQQIGPYHKKFTAIVGPNGSGKSNVIDAMLFVFGKKAKQIRLDRLSSLIHKSDQHPDLKYAKVTVFFQEIIDYEDSETDFQLVPKTELTLSRYCFHDNTSKYEVGGRKSTYAEVTGILREKGVDLDHNRFLILQGEVESIALMKPKAPNEHEDGLLEYIEDIVGTQHYKPKIEEKEKSVEELTEQREVYMQRTHAAEKDCEALSGPKQEAEQYLRQEIKLVQVQAKFLQYKTLSHTRDAEIKTAEVAEARGKLEEEKAQTAAEVRKIEDMQKELGEKKRACDKLKKTSEKLAQEYRELDEAAAQKKTNMEHARKKIDAQNKQYEKARAEVEKQEKANEKAAKESENAAAELQQLEPRQLQTQEEFERETERLQAELKPLRERKDKMLQELQPHNTRVGRCEEALREAEQQRKGLMENQERIEKRLQAEKLRLEEVRKRISQIKDDGRQRTAAHGQLLESIAQQQGKLQRAKEAHPKIKARVTELLTSSEQKRNLVKDTTHSSVLTNILRDLKNQGGLEGFYGRLGDLGTIPEKFDCAISTAAGGLLNHLVCDGEATAKRILAYLKSNSKQRASCVLLDQQEKTFGNVCRQRPSGSPPPGCCRLFEHIKPNEAKFAPVFYWAVRETLVADNLDIATKAAYDGPQRRRVVTWNGEIIETSGAMSGGGQHVMRGGMKSKHVDPKLMQELEAEQKELRKISADEKVLTETISQLQFKLDQDKESAEEAQRDLNQLGKMLRAEKQKEEAIQSVVNKAEQELLQSQTQADGAALAEADQAIGAARKALEEARAAKKDMDDQLQLLVGQMECVGGPNYARLKEMVKINASRISQLTQSRDKAHAAATAGAKAVERARKRAELAQSQVKEAEKELAALDQEEHDGDDKLAVAKEAMQGAERQYKEARQEFDAKDKERDMLKESIVELKKMQVKIEHDVGQKEQDLKVYQQKLDKYTGILGNMKQTIIKHIEEFGPTVLPSSDMDDPQSYDPSNFSLDLSQAEKDEYLGKEEEAAQALQDATRAEVHRLEEAKAKLSPNLKAIKEWREKHEVYLRRSRELQDINEQRQGAIQVVDQLKKQRHEEFMTGFKAITYKLKEMYQMLTMGGDAELELVDSFDPFTEGLQFCVRPPRKSWKNIGNLSGGEKTLSSLALVFALHHFKPTPLYVMDEIDAALDFKNVSIVANYVKSAAKNAQFIIISLRNNMFELANRLVGIFKTDNCTRSGAINPANFIRLLPQPSRDTAARHGTAAVKPPTPQGDRPAAVPAASQQPNPVPPPDVSQPAQSQQRAGRGKAQGADGEREPSLAQSKCGRGKAGRQGRAEEEAAQGPPAKKGRGKAKDPEGAKQGKRGSGDSQKRKRAVESDDE
eukprot:TRINITY_DN2688_c0_g1_i1.p1 TRINITY_DN2688_c0_g1~~TRINITY_DN2688_c0_g1_i1.p1  ORF type:complete len:1442 (+),score=678.76 TRINITY_DN2688_c0_g1_i1:119-4327(+)